MPRRSFEHLMTPEGYETAVRERFANLYPEPECDVIGGAKCFRPGRLSGVPRQIDVGVVRRESPEDLLLVADAKRHGRRLDVTDVEAFLGYLEDIGSRGILASLLGGSPGALRRADAGGADVHVVTYAEALSFDWPRVAAGLYPWDTGWHPTLAAALPLLNRGQTHEFLEVIDALPFEEWDALFCRAPAHLTENEKVPEAKAEVVTEQTEASTLVDTLFDIGLAWAEFGVGQGKKALETSARTLEKVAATLDDLQQKLRKDAA